MKQSRSASIQCHDHTSNNLGKVIQKIFAKKIFAESLLSVESNLMLTKKLLFPYLTLLSALTSIIAVKYGMFSVKHNHNDFKNYKIELLVELY